MLEEVLKSINSNLERIAKVLEAETIENVTDVMHENAKQFRQAGTTATVQPTVQSAITEIPQMLQPIQPEFIQPAQQPLPVATIPTAQAQESFTQEQLAVAMSNAVSAGKMATIQGILQQFGVQALTQIAPADYNKVAVALKEAGVKV